MTAKTKRPRGSGAPLRSDAGDMELHYAKDLTVIPKIQRRADNRRLVRIAQNWDSDKEGILLVARITDGEHKGKLHVYDGGTRLRAKTATDVADIKPEPEYVFVTYVRSMTEKEAARAFMDFNMLSVKPHAIDQYYVGVEAGEPIHLALKEALDSLGLKVGTGDSSKVVNAVKAVEGILKKNKAKRRDADFTRAVGDLKGVLEFAMTCYTDTTRFNGGFLAAINELFMMNSARSEAKLERLRKAIQGRTVKQWETLTASATPSGVGPAYGSNDRPRAMAELLGYEANKRLRGGDKSEALRWEHPKRGWT